MRSEDTRKPNVFSESTDLAHVCMNPPLQIDHKRGIFQSKLTCRCDVRVSHCLLGRDGKRSNM